jgi:lactate dehydrogenase-like 2-hydroxyacid dehydrogenase
MMNLARHFPPAVETRVAERYRVVRHREGNVLSAAKLAAAATGADYLYVSATETVSRDVIVALSATLKEIGALSVGFDHIDLAAACEFGIAVFHAPEVLSEACAEFGMLLVLNAARRGHEADALVRLGKWTGWASMRLVGTGLVRKRLGVLGMGRIGGEVAQRARPFGMTVHYHNRKQLSETLEEDAVYHATPEQLLAVSDVTVISTPASPALRVPQ